MSLDEKKMVGLGDVARDTISGFTGVAVAVCKWLSGCVRITVAPQTLHEGKLISSETFDAEQLVRVTTVPPREGPAPPGGERIANTQQQTPQR